MKLNSLFYEATGNYYKEFRKKDMMRVFVAVEISDDKLIENIRKFQSEVQIKANPVSPENLHFTLQFLGEVSEDMVVSIKNALSTIDYSQFTLMFKEIGVFPKPKFPRIIWIGTDREGGRKMTELSKKVENVLEPLGFKKDKPFKPHMTIFRIKNKIGNLSNELKKFRGYSFGTQKIESVKFKQSKLTPNGPIYSDLGVINLK